MEKRCIFLIVTIFCFLGIMANNVQRVELRSDWQFKQVRQGNWLPAIVPGTVHTDLMANGIIPDPFIGLNERGVQWIDKEDWIYRTAFGVDESIFSKHNVWIEFDGLDTYADVYLNDSLIIKADNMFRRWKADIRQLLKRSDNELKVYFHSPVKVDVPKWDALPYHYEAANDQSENGGLFDKKISIFARKAGYHYGWDWGPRLVTSGIWRKVSLVAWNDVRITDVYTEQPLVSKAKAKIRQTVEIFADADGMAMVQTTDHAGNNYADKKVKLEKGVNTVTLEFCINKPKLWWCNGLGKPNLYTFNVKVQKDDSSDTYTQRTGIRSIKLLTQKDEWGQEFCFELNGVRVFMKGADYIPCDNFLPRVTKSVYEKTIQDAVDVNMNMLRVWGGGIYEDDYFYELCDEKGILIWQDFMFACSLYPASGALLENIRQEAIDNVRRLRNHPCIALWCGNNECQDGWYNWGWKKRLEDQKPEYAEKVWKEYEDLFYHLLPEVVGKYHSAIAYWPSSPFGGYGHGSIETSGDYHYWAVWHAKKPISEYNNTRFRFCSEYGMQSFPEFESVKQFAPQPNDWDIYSDVMMSHQRGGMHANQLIESYLLSEYKRPKDFESLLYVGQLMQGDAMKTAIESHRREKGYCWGTLLWQINDCWPVASWATRDYYGRWKAAHYLMRNSYRDILVSPIEKDGNLQVYIVNDRLTSTSGQLSIKVLDMDGAVRNQLTKQVRVPANVSKNVFSVPVKLLLNHEQTDQVVILAEFTDREHYGNIFYLKPPKDVKFKKSAVVYQMIKVVDGYRLVISADKVARGVFLSLDGTDNFFSDNYFDLIPGAKKQVYVKTDLNEDDFRKQLKITILNNI